MTGGPVHPTGYAIAVDGLVAQWARTPVARVQNYRETSNICRTKSQNLDVSRPVLQLPLPKPLKPGVQSRMKM